ncbi:MAG: acyl-CoA dehydrogenase family protein, partial [Mycobacterium sp.]|nr:acyl-CoA dehydrogenase family protein [Mycobacterium sp.]
MKLALSASEAAFREELRSFYRREIPMDIRERMLGGQVPTKQDIVTSHKILHAAGLAVPQWPKRWGGQEFTALQRHIWLDEMQLAGVPEPLFFNVQMLGPVLINFASESLARRFLPATAALDIWWCQGFSEPEAGSDLASLRTRAVREGDHYVVDGQKTWTTSAQHADWIFTLVRTDPTALKRQAGISFLLIDLNSPGVTRRPIELIDGSHEVNEIFFDEVRVPAENLVGQENQGWKYAKFLLGNERTGIGSVGRGKVQLARAKQYAAQSRTPAGTLLDDPLVSARIAELENDLLALELTQLRVVTGSSEG